MFALILYIFTGYLASTAPVALAQDVPGAQQPLPFLNFSSPAPHIFSSVHGLLQQWSNTFFPNGHTIAPCEIPRHTLLFHGRHDAELPPSPEWLAFDIEMAYGIMGSMGNSRMLTYRTARTVKCIYFDGMSASLEGTGTESQMTFLYNSSDNIPSRPWPGRPGRPGEDRPGGHRPPPDDGGKPPGRDGPFEGPPGDFPGGHWNPLQDEYFRARGLCNWIKEQDLGGTGWGYEGIVRMNAGFEVIWCDFNSTSLQLVSNLNVSVPQIESPSSNGPDLNSRDHVSNRPRPQDQFILPNEDEGPHGPSMTDPNEPFRGVATWMWFTAATRRYGSTGSHSYGAGRGETRVKINTCDLFSFYDPQLNGQARGLVESEQKELNISRDGLWQGPVDENERSAALEKLLRRRRSHRTNHVSTTDGTYMKTAVLQRLSEYPGTLDAGTRDQCSGIDWHLTAQEIVSFFSSSIRSLRELTERFATGSTDKSEWIFNRDSLESMRALTHWLMMPFFEYPQGPWTNETLEQDLAFDSPAALAGRERCRGWYDLDTFQDLNDAERLLSWSTRETLGGICDTVFKVGLDVELEWLQNYNIQPERYDGQIEVISQPLYQRAEEWRNHLDELMAWLGWADQWTSCNASCAANVSLYTTCLKI